MKNLGQAVLTLSWRNRSFFRRISVSFAALVRGAVSTALTMLQWLLKIEDSTEIARSAWLRTDLGLRDGPLVTDPQRGCP